MKFGKIKKVFLFGGAPILLETARWLKNENIPLKIYTSQRHVDESLNNSGETLGDLLNRGGISFVVTDDINAEPTIRNEIDDNSLGLGFGEAWSFDADLIRKFNGRLLDFMGIPHPRYRGGAHYTWMILRGDRIGACNLQVINTDMVQGVFDSGEIVKTKPYLFPPKARTPQDYFDGAVKHEVKFLKEFLNDVKKGKDFKFKKPDESKSLYLPRLNTGLHGWLDWSWTGEDIDRFICAFDNPYKGASTRLNGARVHLKGATLDQKELPFHPFQSGLITRIWNHVVTVATRSGHLHVKSVLNEEGIKINDRLAVGMRFVTPVSDLESAKTTSIQYGANK